MENLKGITSNYLILKQKSISLNLVKENKENKKVEFALNLVKENKENEKFEFALNLVKEKKENEKFEFALNLAKENKENEKVEFEKNREEKENFVDNADYDVVNENVSKVQPNPSPKLVQYFKLLDGVQNIFECVFCEEKEVKKINVTHHIRKSHPEIEDYKCKVCNKKFGNVSNLEDHFHIHHRPHPYQCINCDFTSGGKRRVWEHFKNQHLPKNPKKRFDCKRCCYTTHIHHLMKQHLQNTHGDGPEKIECDQCGVMLRGKASLHTHIKVKHGRERYQCSRCPYRAITRSYLKIHEESRHDGIMRECSQCEFKAFSQNNLNNHIDTIHKGIRYNCRQCSKVFRNKTQVKYHEVKKHNVPHTFRERIDDA